MSSWSGETEISFDIERYILSDGSVTIDGDEKYYKCINLTITGKGYYSEGKYSGSPDSCYPSDSDLEVQSAIDVEGKDWLDSLTGTERKAAEDELWQEIQSLALEGEYDE